ncbi:hypothetical protein, partial [Allosalinactinospora lopnorensis]|uniref:hypothetical protein n=1 Tax=Allosalinactinospora lopnorensis TaxID=1352348 RepID=UPI001F17623D
RFTAPEMTAVSCGCHLGGAEGARCGGSRRVSVLLTGLGCGIKEAYRQPVLALAALSAELSCVSAATGDR